MKRILAILLAVVMAFAMSGVTALGAPNGELTVTSVSGKAGETVDVPVKMDNNPGLIALFITIQHDADLTLVKVTNGEVLPANTLTPGGNVELNPYNLHWLNATATTDYTTNGTLVTFTFRIAEDAKPGEKQILLSYSSDNTFNRDLGGVSFTVKSGAVNVRPTGELAVESVSGKAGETVDVPVRMNVNPGLVALFITIEHDDDLTLTEVTNGNALPANIMTPGGNVALNPYNMHWLDATAHTDYTTTGTLVTFTFRIADNAQPGEKAITLSYSQKNTFDKDMGDVFFTVQSGTVTVTAPEKQLTSIAVKTAPNKTTYYVGESLDQTGLTLTATYSDGSTKEITSGFTCSPTTLNTAGTQTITVTYEGKTTTFTVTVQNNPTVAIRNYAASKTIDYRTTITFTAEVTDAVPGASVHWFINDQDKGAADTYTEKEAKQNFTVQAKYIKDGKVLAESQTEKVTVNAGLLARIIAFFRGLFGRLPKIAQEVFGVQIDDRVYA